MHKVSSQWGWRGGFMLTKRIIPDTGICNSASKFSILLFQQSPSLKYSKFILTADSCTVLDLI